MYLSFEEKSRIETGMLADLVVLDKDPREVPERIANIQVEMIFVDGKLVHKREDKPCA